jgi:predicted metalloprotease with PDZ domain
MGQFDVTQFMVEGRPHDFVANPAGVFSAEKTRTLIGHLTKLAETQGRIFGGLPYRKFVYFYFFRPAEASATVPEHQNSYVALWNAGAQAQPDDMVAQASHEFFHVWNVKRIRPVQMWPYDYTRENETPLLWVFEGFTTYYGSLAAYRAGLRDARSFLDEVAMPDNNYLLAESRMRRSSIAPRFRAKLNRCLTARTGSSKSTAKALSLFY